MKTIEFDRLPTVPLAEQNALCEADDFSGVYRKGGSFADFLYSLPALGAGRALMQLRDALLAARRGGHGVLLMCGGHLVERGLTPIVNRAIADQRISALAITGSAMVKDVEVALAGRVFASQSAEGVGSESCTLIKEAIDWAAEEGCGLGASVGHKLIDVAAPHREHSMLAAAAEAGMPLTVHPAIGADAYNRFPHLNGEAFGAAAVRDFREFTAMVAASSHGVILNVASAVVMPRLLQEAMTAVRSSGMTLRQVTAGLLATAGFAEAESVVRKAVGDDGHTLRMHGAIELLLPLVMAAVIEAEGG